MHKVNILKHENRVDILKKSMHSDSGFQYLSFLFKMHGINANTRQFVVLKKNAERKYFSFFFKDTDTSEMSRQKDPSERSVINIRTYQDVNFSVSVCACIFQNLQMHVSVLCVSWVFGV